MTNTYTRSGQPYNTPRFASRVKNSTHHLRNKKYLPGPFSKHEGKQKIHEKQHNRPPAALVIYISIYSNPSVRG